MHRRGVCLLVAVLTSSLIFLSGCNESSVDHELTVEAGVEEGLITQIAEPVTEQEMPEVEALLPNVYELAKAEVFSVLNRSSLVGGAENSIYDCGLVSDIDAATTSDSVINEINATEDCIGERFNSENAFITGFLSEPDTLSLITYYHEGLFFWDFDSSTTDFSNYELPMACIAPIDSGLSDSINLETRFDCGYTIPTEIQPYVEALTQTISEDQLKDIVASRTTADALDCSSVLLPGRYDAFAEESWESDLDRLRACLESALSTNTPFYASIFAPSTDTMTAQAFVSDGSKLEFWYYDSLYAGLGTNSRISRSVCTNASLLPSLEGEEKLITTQMLRCEAALNE